VSDPEDAKRLVQFTLGHFGRLRCAGQQRRHRPRRRIRRYAVEDFDRVLRVNLRGAFLCGQAAARQMLAQTRTRPVRVA